MFSSRLGRTLVAAAVAAICSAAFATTTHADPVKCKAAIVKASATYAQARTKALQKCEDAVVKGKLPQGTACKDEVKAKGTIDKARLKLSDSIGKACGGTDKACGGATDDDSGFPATCPNFEGGTCNNAVTAGDCSGISTCLLCVDDAAIDQAIGLYYDALVPTDAKSKDKREKALNKCQAAIGKAGAAFLAAQSKALQKCWDGKNKGKINDCPDVKVGDAVSKAALKVASTINGACGGKDKQPGGSGDAADFTPTEIGFPATCQDVTFPGLIVGCAGAISDLQTLNTCVGCISRFKAGCADRAGAGGLTTYPSECNPGPVGPTPTVAPTPRACGNGADPQLCDPSSAGYACGADFACTNCNCACPSLVHFTGDATNPKSILDSGFSGIAHRAPIITNGDVTVDLNCAAGSRPCGVCPVTGPVPNPQAGTGELDNHRCSSDPSLKCAADATCTAAANTCSGGTNDGAACAVPSCGLGSCSAGVCVGGANAGAACCNGGFCRATGTCTFYFGSALPLAAGGVSTCVVNQFKQAITGTANVETGDASTTAFLTTRVYNGLTVDTPCPQCLGDASINVAATQGTCDAGPRQGFACDANGTVPNRPDFGTTSLDCPPSPLGVIATLTIDLSSKTSTVIKTLTTASPACGGAAGNRCLCDTCNNANAEVCDDNTDCPDPAGAVYGPVCGGRRCLSGVNVGAACSVGSECPGSSCSKPGTATTPTGCTDNTTVYGFPNNHFDCSDPDLDGVGRCEDGPNDGTCSVASGHAQRGCSSDGECGGAALSCESIPRACFLTGGGTFSAPADQGSDTLIAVGIADVPMNDIANPTLGAVFCVGPTSAPSINNVAGLPGPARVTIAGTATGLP